MEISTEELGEVLAEVAVLAFRLHLETPGVRATLPMLRGVWGAALRDADRSAYDEVFEGVGPPEDRTPRYVLRGCAPDVRPAPALEWILVGDFGARLQSLMGAWEAAARTGLGPDRLPFQIRQCSLLDASGRPVADPSATPGFTLAAAPWPLRSAPATTPCRLVLESPTRLIFRGRLIEQPTLADLVVACCRRVTAIARAGGAADALTGRVPELLALARSVRSTRFEGSRLDVQRYSGRQKREVELRGVVGHVDLPEGPSALWPLFVAASWIHIGKGTTLGMGRLRIDPLQGR